ncbi:uncharacterized protein LOC127856869 isoform X2 [Dreissena polymorpha]|uniref:uncharacterized protein LOC127856869 isoform X2 n=1 Tax=Dreissena polymorpha TaxID=45954 RepID=UPI002263FD6C|nr:uncharacterized protein LOC127856869 isoform X2 [Dreissena polymorpha]
MASYLESSINKGSDFDFSCFTCQENERNTEAEFYCEECAKFFCGKCVKLHNSLFKKHATLGKVNISQWPENNVDSQELCQEHKKEKLTGFCEDHSELICHACHINNHQKCSHVVHIADKVKNLHQKGDFKQLSATVKTQQQHLIHKKDDFEENMKSLEKSYQKILEEMNALRKTINDSLDLLEKNTKKELDTLLATMRTSIQTDIEICSKSITNITCLEQDLQTIKDKSEALSFIKYRKCLDQSHNVEAVLQEMTYKNERTLTFNPATTIQQTLSTLSGLGQILSTVKQSQPAKRTTQNTETRQNKLSASSKSDTENQTTPGFKVKKSNPESSSSRQYSTGNQTSDVTKSGHVSDPVASLSHLLIQGCQPGGVIEPDPIIKVNRSKKYNVKIVRDSSNCFISGICETATGELLISDYDNNCAKLLDQTFKVVAHCDLPDSPWSMCSIDSSAVAVILNNCEVHFIRVTNGQLVKNKILKLQHSCTSIAHHKGNLYIAGGSALYRYTVVGRLMVSKMYENTSDLWTACAVSPDGDRIYVANLTSNQLVTLSRDGTVISRFTDPALDWRWNAHSALHVTDSGQVLVCGVRSRKIIQVDRDGRQRLAEVVTEKDGVTYPSSVYYRKHTGSLIVGMSGNDDIIVFESQ